MRLVSLLSPRSGQATALCWGLAAALCWGLATALGIAMTLGCRAEPTTLTPHITQAGSDAIQATPDNLDGDAADANRDADLPAQVSAVVAPYVQQLRAQMDETIGTVAEEIIRDRPESALGNLVADALLAYGRNQFGADVQLAIVNHGGIRVPSLAAGPLSVGRIYELIPFDNRVVLLTMTGQQLDDLFQALAERGGEPVAGMTYRLNADETAVEDIRINDVPLDPAAAYKVVTVDYLASIGGRFAKMQEATARIDDATYLRDAVIQYIRTQKEIRPVIDGRISHDDSE